MKPPVGRGVDGQAVDGRLTMLFHRVRHAGFAGPVTAPVQGSIGVAVDPKVSVASRAGVTDLCTSNDDRATWPELQRSRTLRLPRRYLWLPTFATATPPSTPR